MTRVIVDRKAGFCAGVRGAVEGALRVLREKPEADGRSTARIVSYGQLVHNREVTDELCEAGLKTVESLESLCYAFCIV